MSMRKVYRKIARENGTTVKEVRAEMQAAITAAWNNPGNEIIRAYQAQVPTKGNVPTPEEVISYVAHKSQNERQRMNSASAHHSPLMYGSFVHQK